MKTLNILIVDDSANLRKVIRRYIESGRESYVNIHGDVTLAFSEAGNGAEAEAVLQLGEMDERPIDLVFLDWMMPAFSGLQFLQKIRSTELFKVRPAIVMLTAETYSDQINACLKYGVLSYVTKPFEASTLVQAVQQALSGGFTKAHKEIKYAV